MYAEHFKIEVFTNKDGKWDAKVSCKYCNGNVFRTRDRGTEVFETEEDLWDRIIEAYSGDNGATLDIHLMQCNKFQDNYTKVKTTTI